MKHDINLLQKRKAAQYSSKKMGTILLVVLLFAALLYAGITLPSSMLASAQIKLTDLNGQLESQTQIEQELAQKTLQNATLQAQLQQLDSLSATKANVTSYLEAVESSLPTSARITSLTLSGNTMSIGGFVPRDEVLATFALRLRETGAFSDVFVANSTVVEEGKTNQFSLSAILPETMSSATEVTAGSADAATDGTAAQPTASPAAEQPTASPAAVNTEATK